MPLEKGNTPEIIGRNIQSLILAGRKVEHAAAIAYRYALDHVRAAGVCFRYKGQVLLMLRAEGSDYAATWAFPGGTIEDGETPEVAARREVLEETGIDYQGPLTPIDFDNNFMTYLAELDERPSVTLNEEHDGYGWVAQLPACSWTLLPFCRDTLENLPNPAAPGVALDKKSYDTNGWFEVKDNPISKVGVFPYLGSSLGMTGAEAGKMFNIYRPAEELGAPECVESFKLLPWIDDHVMLGPVAQEQADGVPAEKKGVQGVTGQDVYFDEAGGYLRANIKVFSDTMGRLIEAGKKELSAGYTCAYEMTPGTHNGVPYDGVQRNMRGNHLALVQEGRMGPDVAVLDTKEGFKMSDLPKDAEGAKEPANDSMTLEQVTALLKNLAPQVAELTAAFAAMGKPAEVEDAPKDMMPTAMDAVAKAIAQFGQRDELAQQLSRHIGTFDHKNMSLQQVVDYGCDKLKLRKDAGVLEGYLKAAPCPAQDRAVSFVSTADAATGPDPIAAYLGGK